jgi:hypothetical protein
VKRLRNKRFGFRIPVVGKVLSLFQNAETDTGVHPASCSVGFGGPFPGGGGGQSGCCMKVAIYIRLVPRLRIGSDMPLLFLFVMSVESFFTFYRLRFLYLHN